MKNCLPNQNAPGIHPNPLATKVGVRIGIAYRLKLQAFSFVCGLQLIASLLPLTAAETPQLNDAAFFNQSVFEEPLVPTGQASAKENEDLEQALGDFQRRSNPEDFSAITQFLQTHPKSVWRASLLTNLGIIYRRHGYFSRAMECWEKSWTLLKDQSEPRLKALADRTIGELLHINAWVGRYEQLEPLLQEIEGRKVRGPGSEKVACAREGLWKMNNRPETAFKCGPFAVDHILKSKSPLLAFNEKVRAAQSPRTGLSLTEVWKLAQEVGLDYQMAQRSSGAEALVPSVVHWKLNHYGALLEAKDGKYHCEDATLNSFYGQHFWLSAAALDEEASGYFLVPSGPLPKGWKNVSEEEGGKIFGKGDIGTGDARAYTPEDQRCPECPKPPKGMAQPSVHALLVSLSLWDTPLFYDPPRGPRIAFSAYYNQRDGYQPGNFNYSNLGPKWTFDWLSYVIDDPNNASADVDLYRAGGGINTHIGYNSATQTYSPELRTKMVLARLSSTSYELRYPDGSKDLYAQTNGVTTAGRKVFRTAAIDAQGNTNAFVYGANLRMAYVIDSLNQTNSIQYASTNSADSAYYQIAKVTDPFGRSANFSYDGLGRLTNITDVVGIASSFAYEGNGDFIKALTTPYGTTQFEKEEVGEYRALQTTDPMGRKERVEFKEGVNVFGSGQGSEDGSQVPTGMSPGAVNAWMNYRNSYYWDKKAMAETPGNYTNTHTYHWLHPSSGSATAPILESEKSPLENRVWYTYQGQSSPLGVTEGMSAQPAYIGRVLDDGTTQLQKYEYNSLGKRTKSIDPLGRATLYLYQTNDIDLLEVSQVLNSPVGTTNTLAKFTYNSQHLPLTAIDAAGQTNSFSYNSYGQLTQIQNPKSETTTLNYNSSGYLTNIVGAMAGAVTSFAYDSKGRVRTVTDSSGYTITTDYDNLNRVTKVTYPDNTTDETVYDKLDPVQMKDRLGRVTRSFYNASRQVMAVQDALGRITQMQWCDCGSLEKIIDPLGRVTTWIRDLQGRVTDKVYADGTVTSYAYEAKTSRLKSVKDAKNQFILYSYWGDDNLKQVAYSNAVVATPSVSYTWSTNFNRIETMVDGIGTNAYSYHTIAAGTLGAGRLASIDGPFANDTMSYGYDSLGRVVSRAIGSSTNSVTFDALGRVTVVQNALGAFTNSYVGATERIAAMVYPNGQSNAFSYAGTTNDLRLSEIKNMKPGGTVISKFNYSYSAEGQITEWTKQADAATPEKFEIGYDRADQVVSAALKNTSTGAILKRYVYGYDKAGNRTSEQVDTTVSTAGFNNVNELTSLVSGGAGPIRFKGRLNEQASVTVAGTNATMDSGLTNFNASVALGLGSNTISVIARDYGAGSGNVKTNSYSVVVANGSTNTLRFDLVGNCITNSSATITNAYAWDAANRLLSASSNGTQLVAFTYDGLSRRTRMIQGSTTNNFVWCDGPQPCQLRNAAADTVLKEYFPQGFKDGSTKYFWTRDHLGSIREVVDSTGTNIVARYDYTPYGIRSLVSGTDVADFGFTGHYFQKQTQLHLALYRAYDANLGRWQSRDPLEERAGLNLFAYVLNDPVGLWDPLGLDNYGGQGQNFTSNVTVPGHSYGPAPSPGVAGAQTFGSQMGSRAANLGGAMLQGPMVLAADAAANAAAFFDSANQLVSDAFLDGVGQAASSCGRDDVATAAQIADYTLELGSQFRERTFNDALRQRQIYDGLLSRALDW